MKKGFIIAAVILVVAGTLIFAIAFIASDFDFSRLDTDEYETNTYALNEDFETIEIISKEANIILKNSDNQKPSVDCVERTKVRYDVYVKNGVLKIIVVDNRSWYDYLTLFSFRPQSITVYLPSNFYKSLTVKTSTGDINIDDFRAEMINLSVSTGKICGRNIECAKTFSTEVSTGKISLTDIMCKSFISIGSTGDITLKNVLASDECNIKRNTGDVIFDNCDALKLTVRTSTGDVTGTLRSEKNFIAKTSTGKINVPDTNSGGKCEITTSTGDILIELTR